MEPVILALEKEYSANVAFIIADIDTAEGRTLVDQFNVSSIPAYYFINPQGKIIANNSGLLNKKDLEDQIINLLKNESLGQSEGFMQNFFTTTIPKSIKDLSLFTLIVLFLGGLLTSLSPCIFSMLPVMVGFIGGYELDSKRKGFLLSLTFILGLAITFSFLGIAAALAGKVFGQIGVGWFYVIAIVAIIMGLQMLGVITIHFPTLPEPLTRKKGYTGAFLVGMSFGLVASPCATPVLAVLMTYVAAGGQLWYGGLLLFVYGLGHGLPLLLAGTFTSLLKQLPRLQRWSPYVTYFSGIVMICLGLYFFYRTTWF